MTDRAAPATEAGRVLLHEHSSGTPHMLRHILAIEAEAGQQAREALDATARELHHVYHDASGGIDAVEWRGVAYADCHNHLCDQARRLAQRPAPGASESQEPS